MNKNLIKSVEKNRFLDDVMSSCLIFFFFMIVTCYKTLSSFTTGAFNITREAQQKSRMAQSKVDGTQVMLNESMKTRSEVEKMLEDHKDAFNQKIQENEADLNEIDGKVSSLGSRIADLNQMVIK